MRKKKETKKPYIKRNDLEKIKSNWGKTIGLYKRKDWSASIVRAATTVEIAANYVIRQELEVKRHLEKQFVDRLLVWANGIQGKMDRLIIPILNISISEELKAEIKKINKERNSIVHSGQFKKNTTAREIIRISKEVIEELTRKYDKYFVLKEIKNK